MPKSKEQKKKDREKRVHAKKIASSTGSKPVADVAVSAQEKAIGPKLRVDLHSSAYEKIIPKSTKLATRKRGGI